MMLHYDQKIHFQKFMELALAGLLLLFNYILYLVYALVYRNICIHGKRFLSRALFTMGVNCKNMGTFPTKLVGCFMDNCSQRIGLFYICMAKNMAYFYAAHAMACNKLVLLFHSRIWRSWDRLFIYFARFSKLLALLAMVVQNTYPLIHNRLKLFSIFPLYNSNLFPLNLSEAV